MIYWLTGNDYYKWDQVIEEHKSKLDSNFLAFNFHKYSVEDLESAATESISMPFGDQHKLLVIVGEIKAEHEPYIKTLVDCPDFSIIILRVTVDGRTKVGQLIKKNAKLLHYSLPSLWKQNDLAAYITQEAYEIGLSIPNPVALYLVEAIGEDSYRLHNELEKIRLYKGDNKITLQQIKELVPNLNQNVIQLAEAIRLDEKAEVLSLANNLLDWGEHPLKITAALLTIFRRLLIVKTVSHVSDGELAKRCNLNNANRLYYLRQEANTIGEKRLIKIVVQLFEMECRLKFGLTEDQLINCLLAL